MEEKLAKKMMTRPHFLMQVKDFARRGGGFVQPRWFFFSNNFFTGLRIIDSRELLAALINISIPPTEKVIFHKFPKQTVCFMKTDFLRFTELIEWLMPIVEIIEPVFVTEIDVWNGWGFIIV